MEAFWWLQGRKGGHSINVQSYYKHTSPDGTHCRQLTVGACDVYEQYVYFDSVVISANRIIKENQQTGISVVQ